MKAINPNGASEFGLREETPEAELMHYFMQPATSVLLTDMPSGSFLPVAVGLEAGIRIHFTSHSHKYPCRCLIEDYYFY